MRFLLKLLYKWQKRMMCKCTSPVFTVHNNKLCCSVCNKPLHRDDVELAK